MSFIKMISHVNFISLVLKIVILSVSIATKLTISKIYHLIRLRFERSEHKKSQYVCVRSSITHLPLVYTLAAIVQSTNLVASVFM